MTNSGSGARPAASPPLVSLTPPASDLRDAEDAIEFAAGYGLKLDPWQEIVLRSWLARRPDGKWAASRCGLAIPRQNGKNACIEVRELYGLVALGEKWLHTAHEVKTARKAFLRLASFFENPRKYPEMADLVKEIRKTNGQEAIVLTNGGSVEFVARSKGSGRGFTVDGLVMDEAQQLTDEALEALLPTISSAPLGNPQQILTGTPPTPTMQGDVWKRTRAAGHAGKEKRLSWLEWAAPRREDNSLPDLDDPKNWARANPSPRLSRDVILDERATFDDEGFARERLGVWGLEDMDSAIPWQSWQDCADVESAAVDPVAFGIDISPSRSRSSIAVVGKRADGRLHIAVVDARPGVEWVVGRCVELMTHKPMCFAVDAAGPANALVQPLREAGLEVDEVGTRGLTQACGQLYDLVVSGGLAHRDEGAMADAVRGAAWRSVGESRAWARKTSKTDITPLYAATVALHAFGVRDKPTDPVILFV